MEDHEEEAKAIEFDPTTKFQGQEKLYKFLQENPKLLELLEADIKSIL